MHAHFIKTLPALLLALLLTSPLHAAPNENEVIFSGPQPGEKLPNFTAIGVYDKLADKNIDVVKQADGKAILLVFVHKLSRPGHALAKAVTNYFHALKRKDLEILVVHLAPDHLAQRDYLTRARPSLNYQAPLAVSNEGEEGPGSYGLNRNVSYTYIIANNNKVVANFALVQPSLTEAAKIAKPLALALKMDPPTQEEIQELGNRYFNGKRMTKAPARGTRGAPAEPAMRKPARGQGDAAPKRGADAEPQRGDKAQPPANPFRDAVKEVINNAASPDDVKKAIANVEAMIKDKPGLQNQLGTMSEMILQRGMGSAAAQKQIKIWLDKYGQADK